MSIQRSQLETALSTHIPQEILEKLLDEYQEIKKQFLLRKFRPSELNAARFSECVLRLSDTDLIKWIKYSNPSRYKKQILRSLDDEALIHYDNGLCTILPKGICSVENNIDLELII